MARQKKNDVPASRIGPAPIVLIVAQEKVLGERAAQRVISQVRDSTPDVNVVHVDARTYQPGTVAIHASPALFGGSSLIYASYLENMNDAFLDDMLHYVKNPNPDLVVILLHGGGNRGKKLLDAVAQAGFPQTTIEKVTKDNLKAGLIRDDVREAGRKITDDAVEHLVDAFGQDVRELLAITGQLIADTEGMITEEHVRIFSAGRSSTTPFDVAELAVTGHTGKALIALRHAFAQRVDPVPIVAALAVKLRQLGLAQGAGRGRGNVGMAPWQLDRARRQLRSWSGDGLAAAICAVADADERVKGGSRDPQFAVEDAIIKIGQARKMR